MSIPVPQIGIGPDFDNVAVQLWTWPWVDDPGPPSMTVTAGTVSVTAVATLSTTTWTMGEPVDNPDTERFVRTAPVVVRGGIGATAGLRLESPAALRVHVPLEITEVADSGTAKWPMTVTADWTATWSATTGESGTIALTATSNTAVEVGEYRIVLVQGG